MGNKTKLVAAILSIAFVFVVVAIIFMIVIFRSDKTEYSSNAVKIFISFESSFIFAMLLLIGASLLGATSANVAAERNLQDCIIRKNEMEQEMESSKNK